MNLTEAISNGPLGYLGNQKTMLSGAYNYWYMKPAYVKKAFLEGDVFKQAISDANKESVLKHDQAIHQRKASPAWKTMEFMSFGVIISLYENLTDGGLQHDISMVYGMSAPTQFANYMNTIRRLRNSCAHGKVLYDMNLTEAISNGPLGYLGNQKTMLSGAYNHLTESVISL